jgi:hypothetical protein
LARPRLDSNPAGSFDRASKPKEISKFFPLDIFEDLIIILFCPQKRREAYARA